MIESVVFLNCTTNNGTERIGINLSRVESYREDKCCPDAARHGPKTSVRMFSGQEHILDGSFDEFRTSASETKGRTP